MVWERRRDEDELDRVNRLWTVLILGIAGVSALVYVAVFPDDAISCSPTNSDVVGSALHANRFCLSLNAISNENSDYYYGYYITSYQNSLPVFLFIQLLAFLFPHVLANFLGGLFGDDAKFLIMCAEKATLNKDDSFLQDKVKSLTNPSQKLSVVYLLKKSLILANSLIQLVVVALNSKPDLFMTGYASVGSPFPPSTYCKVDGTTYFCALHVNGTYYKFYVCLFYWLLVLSVMNIGSLIGWVLKLFLPRMTSKTINTYTMTPSTDNPEKTQRFLKDVIGRDYLLSLLMAESTEREITAGKLILQMWQSYEPSPAVTVEPANGDGNVSLSQL